MVGERMISRCYEVVHGTPIIRTHAALGYMFYDGTSAGPASDYVRLNTRLFLPNIER
jgi:hypothetical protein